MQAAQTAHTNPDAPYFIGASAMTPSFLGIEQILPTGAARASYPLRIGTKSNAQRAREELVPGRCGAMVRKVVIEVVG